MYTVNLCVKSPLWFYFLSLSLFLKTILRTHKWIWAVSTETPLCSSHGTVTCSSSWQLHFSPAPTPPVTSHRLLLWPTHVGCCLAGVQALAGMVAYSQRCSTPSPCQALRMLRPSHSKMITSETRSNFFSPSRCQLWKKENKLLTVSCTLHCQLLNQWTLNKLCQLLG